jgi:hypothetical protein
MERTLDNRDLPIGLVNRPEMSLRTMHDAGDVLHEHQASAAAPPPAAAYDPAPASADKQHVRSEAARPAAPTPDADRVRRQQEIVARNPLAAQIVADDAETSAAAGPTDRQFLAACRDGDYRAEYSRDRDQFVALGVSLEDYIRSRRIDEGIDQLGPLAAKPLPFNPADGE